MRKAKGTIKAFTFKDGILARAAHDLQFRLEQFDVGLEGEKIEAELQLKTLFVDGPVEGGVVRPEQYDAGKRADVEKAMHGDVLHTDRNPSARFQGQAIAKGNGFSVSGDLQLAGKTAPMSFDVVRDEAGTYRAQFEMQPSRWGIAQYKALLGAIRLKDLIRVELALSES
jgi:hypothetical protein